MNQIKTYSWKANLNSVAMDVGFDIMTSHKNEATSTAYSRPVTIYTEVTVMLSDLCYDVKTFLKFTVNL